MHERKKQVFNPYLPLDTYIPDGEPHVFGDRLYLYGSHDKEGGDAFCMLDYEVFSAPLSNLADWRSEGIVYRAEQDPDYSEKYRDMYAPDVVKGNDGRYYLYYAMSGGCFTGPIHVAVCDTPAGKFEYHGCVRNADGSPFTRQVTFDPGLINDNGIIRLYYGWSLAVDPSAMAGGFGGEESAKNQDLFKNLGEQLIQAQVTMFEKTREEVENDSAGIMGAYMVVLDDDMLTVKTEPVRIVPGQFDACKTSFEGHAFFEASSMRKINDTYYFIYSSQVSHELCYALSRFPDRGFEFGGVIISNGDIGYQGREEKDRLAMTGNNHGSLVEAGGQWYIFYHRQTHKTAYSRQGCAEKIALLPDGKIRQVEMTSCGLNTVPLVAEGSYPAVIACNLTNGHMPHAQTDPCQEKIPYITHNGNERFIADISDGTLVGYKYFQFTGSVDLSLRVRGNAEGRFCICTEDGYVGEVAIHPSKDWADFKTTIHVQGKKALYFKFKGDGFAELLELDFSPAKARCV